MSETRATTRGDVRLNTVSRRARSTDGARSTAGHVAPGERFVDARITGQPQHAFADDIALDLVGPTLDGHRAGAHRETLRAHAADRIELIEVVEGVVVGEM